jgi:hypothetical protein
MGPVLWCPFGASRVHRFPAALWLHAWEDGSDLYINIVESSALQLPNLQRAHAPERV